MKVWIGVGAGETDLAPCYVKEVDMGIRVGITRPRLSSCGTSDAERSHRKRRHRRITGPREDLHRSFPTLDAAGRERGASPHTPSIAKVRAPHQSAAGWPGAPRTTGKDLSHRTVARAPSRRKSGATNAAPVCRRLEETFEPYPRVVGGVAAVGENFPTHPPSLSCFKKSNDPAAAGRRRRPASLTYHQPSERHERRRG